MNRTYSDGDGLDDAWEMAYFDTLDRDGSGDYDGDGHIDRDEWHAGTDPTDAGSVLTVLTVHALEMGEVSVLWSAVPGRRYQVQFKEAVDAPEWTDLPGIVTATGPTGAAVDPGAAGRPRGFYRVRLAP